MASFPWKVALVGGAALAALVAFSGKSHAAVVKPPPGPGPKPNGPKPAPAAAVPIPQPPKGAMGHFVRMKTAGNLRAGPHENSAKVVAAGLPVGARLLAPDINDVRDTTPEAPEGWIAALLVDENGNYGRFSGWVSMALLEGDENTLIAEEIPFGNSWYTNNPWGVDLNP